MPMKIATDENDAIMKNDITTKTAASEDVDMNAADNDESVTMTIARKTTS